MTSARQRRDGRQNLVTLVLGDAGRRLVEQQHARAAGDGERDLEQPLLAVGQIAGALVHHVGEMEALEHLDDLLDHRGAAADHPPPLRAQPHALRDREPDRLERREVEEQLVDLEGARQAAPHPPVGFERR